MSLKPEYLAHKNVHPRDANISFEEGPHIYTVMGERGTYTSVTTWNHKHFPHFDSDAIIEKMLSSPKMRDPEYKYYGMTREEIKREWSNKARQSSSDGTGLHQFVELFMNQSQCESSPSQYTHRELLEMYENVNKEQFSEIYNTREWDHFLHFVSTYPDLKPYRTEWMIYDEECKIAGSIDMVYINEDGTLSIYDWKRCLTIEKTSGWNKYGIEECVNHLPDTNFWHYSLQLNIYKNILEKNYGVEISQLFLVKLHPDNKSGSFELIKLPFLKDEIISLFEVLKTRPIHTKKD
jgi:ATP-dependent exoDNAse (exonuclease V) beta subunit